MPGVIGQAFSFDGVDDYVNIPDSVTLEFTSALTIEAWVKPQTRVTFQKRRLATNSGYTFAVTPTSLTGTVNGAFDHQVSVTVPTDRFSHVAWTYDQLAASSRLYLNGSLVSAQARSNSITNDAVPLQFGRTISSSSGTQYWSGAADEIGIYDHALTQAEIQTIIAVGHSQSCPPSLSLETISVPTNGSVVTSTTTLQSGVSYQLRASGTFTAGGPCTSADADYYLCTTATDFYSCNGESWDMGIGINSSGNTTTKSPSWGPYNSSHIYTINFVGQGAPITFRYHDCSVADNSGSLTVEILRTP